MARARSSAKNSSTANLGFKARLWLAVSEMRKQRDEGRLAPIGLLPSSLKAPPVLRIRYGLLHTFSVLANPPFNDSDWFRKDDDVRWQYGVPPRGQSQLRLGVFG